MIGLAWGAWLTYHGIGLGLIALASYLWFIGPYLRKRAMSRNQAAIEKLTGLRVGGVYLIFLTPRIVCGM